ncbi:MAG: zf-HC2 domain-containing protein [Anaerolineae bacterium]
MEKVRVADCQQAGLLMSLSLDGLLAGEQAEGLQAHLENCPACCLEWALFQEISHKLSNAPMLDPPPGFTGRVMTRLNHQEARRKVFGMLVLVAGALALTMLTMPFMASGLSCIWQMSAHPSLLDRLLALLSQTLEVTGPLFKAVWLAAATCGPLAGLAFMLIYILGLSAPAAIWLRLVARAWGRP